MDPEDEEKTTFITRKGTYCYKVMPFGLTNIGATYQRLVSKVFDGMLGCFVEAYIDDTVVKSSEFEQHLNHLEAIFSRLKIHKVRLNLAKCQFGVKSRVFLGHVISQKGIEAHLNQVKAIMNMPKPNSRKEIQILARRIAALTRLIARMSDWCAPFFKLLQGKNHKKSGWGIEQSEAFKMLKQYLLNPPILDAPRPGEMLHLYLAISKISLSSVLFRCDGGLQKPVFFVSKSFIGAELRYSASEKLILALHGTRKRLSHYFQGRKVIVYTPFPIHNLLAKLDFAGRIGRWALPLAPLDLEFKGCNSFEGASYGQFFASTRTNHRM